jgi:anti-anti-sigma factor
MSIQQISVPLTFPDERRPLLSLHLASRSPAVLVEVAGEIDLTNAHLLTELVDHVAADRPARVVLDLSGVTFFCLDGLRALLHARHTVDAAGGRLLLRAPSPQTGLLLDLTGTAHLFAMNASPSGRPTQRLAVADGGAR